MRPAPLVLLTVLAAMAAWSAVAHADYYIKVLPANTTGAYKLLYITDLERQIAGVYNIPSSREVIVDCGGQGTMNAYTAQLIVDGRIVKIPFCMGWVKPRAVFVRVKNGTLIEIKDVNTVKGVRIYIVGQRRGHMCWYLRGDFSVDHTRVNINKLYSCDSNVSAVVVPYTYISLSYSTWLKKIWFPSLGLSFRGPAVWSSDIVTWWRVYGIDGGDARALVVVVRSSTTGGDVRKAWIVTPEGVFDATEYTFTPGAHLPMHASSSVLYAVAAGGAAALLTVLLLASRPRR